MSIKSKIVAVAVPLMLLGCGEGPQANVISREASSLVPSVAPSADAFTFAQVRNQEGRIATLLVAALGAETIQAVDLTGFGAPLDADIFEVISKLGAGGLANAAARTDARRRYGIVDLLSAAGNGRHHVATATNFPEHAKETEINEVFNFPKFGPATPARTTVTLKPGALLDYEVEICTRFDRDVRTLADFDAARKGFFLCGDFSDRARLLQLINPADVGSGQGFSDAKSGTDFFPTGPFLVVPRDWRSFVRSERMTTQVNRQIRQDARGGEMILDFRAIVRKALIDDGGGTYTYQGAPVPLLAGGRLARGAAVMSGTSEGVIFMPPRAADYISGAARYIFAGPMFRGASAQRTMLEAFADKERRSGRYLKAGDVVLHSSSSMGDVQVRVVQASTSTINARPVAPTAS